MSKRMSLALALLCAAPIVLAGAGMDIGPGGGGVDGGSGDVTAASSLTDNAFVVGDGGSKGVKTISAATARSTLNVEDGADVTDAANVNAAGAVMEADFNAQTILAATADNTPAAVTVGEGELVGRASGGNVGNLTATQVRTILNVEDGAAADQAGSEFIQGGAQEMDGDQIDIDYTPTAYTPSTDPAEASSVDHLTAHLDGIDNALAKTADDGLWVVDWDMGSLYGAAEASGLPAGIDGPAGIASHPTTAPIKVAAYDDTADEGRHRSIYVETSTATVRVRLDSYAQTCSSCSTGARMCVAFMPLSNATWQTAQCIDVDAPGNTTDPVEDTVSASVATWGIQAGERHLVLLYRDGDGTSGTDDLTDDLYVVGARVEGEP